VTVLGAIVGVAVASATVWGIEMRLAKALLGQVEARAVDQLQLGVLDQLSAADFQPPHTPAKAADLAARLDPLVLRLQQADSGVIRVNLVAADGTIVYSDAPPVRGTWMPPGQRRELATALGGAIGATEHSSLSTQENADLKERYGEAFEVYVPVRLGGRVAGAYEIYVEFGELRATLLAVWLLLAGSVGVLFHVLGRWAVARHAPRPGAQGTAPLAATPTVAVGHERTTRVALRELPKGAC
jgi:hypothetical protein